MLATWPSACEVIITCNVNLEHVDLPSGSLGCYTGYKGQNKAINICH